MASLPKWSASLPPRDGEAETFIRQQIARHPGAPYYMAQTIVVQEQALEAAQARIEALEAQASEAPRQAGGLLGGLFGASRQPARAGSVPRVGRSGGAAPQQPFAAAGPSPRGGGGFLSGAAQTAMGVAGGMMLANAIGGMFGSDGEAQAAEAAAEKPEIDDASLDSGDDFGDLQF